MNDAQLRIATVILFNWYFAANTAVFQRCGLIKNIEHMLSLKFYVNEKTFDRVMSKYRRVQFFRHGLLIKSLLLL